MFINDRLGSSSDSNGAIGTLLQPSGSCAERSTSEGYVPPHKSDRSPSPSGQGRLEPLDAGTSLPPARTLLDFGLQPVLTTGARAAMAREYGMNTTTER